MHNALDEAKSAIADLVHIGLRQPYARQPYARHSWSPSDYATLRDTALSRLDQVIDDLELSPDMHDRARELADALSALGQEAHDRVAYEGAPDPIARMRAEVRLFLFTLSEAWVTRTARSLVPEQDRVTIL